MVKKKIYKKKDSFKDYHQSLVRIIPFGLIISSYDVNAIRDFFYNIVASLAKNKFSNIIINSKLIFFLLYKMILFNHP